MLYDVTLHMGFVYDVAATGARHIIRILPLNLPGRQRLIEGSISVSPAPDEKSDFTDFFGQTATAILVRPPHENLDLHMTARVSLAPFPLGADLEHFQQKGKTASRPETRKIKELERFSDSVSTGSDLSSRLKILQTELENIRSVGPASPHHLTGQSPRLKNDRDIAAYARAATEGCQTVREAAISLNGSIFSDFTYDSTATTVDTTPGAAFMLKRGVCQDFAHIMILGLRSLGVPAGYVSGYLRTIPPEGMPRLEGADAMHAWVRVWCGGATGYLELDPTNGTVVGEDHIVVAYGRDYSDIAPVIGALKGYGQQKTTQGVDVVPIIGNIVTLNLPNP